MPTFQTQQKYYDLFYLAHEEAIGFINHGRNDYIAARHLFNGNLLITAGRMASQAAEKLLKAHYVLRGGTNARRFKHHVIRLSNEVTNQGHDLSRFQQCLERLEVDYASRYADSWRDAVLSSAITERDRNDNLFREADELIVHLLNSMPMVREGVLLHCFNPIVVRAVHPQQWWHNFPEYDYLTTNNAAIAPILEDLRRECYELSRFWGYVKKA